MLFTMGKSTLIQFLQFIQIPSYLGSKVGAGQIDEEKKNLMNYRLFCLKSPQALPAKILFLNRQDLGSYHPAPSPNSSPGLRFTV